MAVGAVVARILTQYSDKGSKAAQKDIAKLGRNIDAFGKKATKAFGLATAATIALSVKVGKDAVRAAIEDSKSQLTLSNALQATTGATSQAVAAVENYISKQQMLTNVQDTELRASLQSLVVATGDVTEAQRLQGIALDIAAATGKDLNSVTVAMVRAQQGNTTALKKLSPELSGLITKTTKAEDIFSLLGATYEGSAKKLAKQDPLKNMQLAFGEIAEQVGVALLPAVQVLTDYMVTDLIPTFEEFVRLNDAKITKNVIGLAKAIESLAKNGAGIASFLIEYRKLVTFIVGTLATIITLARTILILSSALAILKKVGILKINISLTRGSLATMKEIGGITRAYAFIVKNARSVAAAIGLITTAFRAQGIAAGIAAIATAFATAGVSVGVAATALLAVGVTAFATKRAFDALNTSQENNAISSRSAALSQAELAKQQYGGAAATKYQAEVAAAAAKKAAEARAKAAAEAAKAAAAKKKQDAIDAKSAALKAQIEKKYGVKITDAAEYENIQLTAVQKLQAKQKDADASLMERIKLRREELALFNALNQNAQRYTDLLQALADEKLSNQEIELLAKKWGLTVDAAKSYIFTVFAIKDEQISEDEIDKLASAWGITKSQAGQYLDFFAALNDGKLSDAEIAKLMAKWGLTKDEAKKYADFVAAIGDGKLDDSEINKLKNTWGLTTQQVVDYIVKIGGKVDASGSTILSAGDIAALGWTNALNALNAYLAALGKGTGGTPTNPVVPPVVVPVVPVVPGVGGSKTDSAAAAASAAASKKAADAYAAAKAKGDMDAAAIAAAGVNPSALAAGESGAIGAASIAAQLRAAETALAVQRNATTLANFKAKEAADLAASQAASTQLDYDERSKFRSMTMANASSISGSSSAPVTVNLTVNGSVSTEEDLVQTIRNGLLLGQTNGNSITLQAI